METLNIKASKSSPLVKYDVESNTLEIAGECYPENAVKFFTPIFQWLDDEINSLNKSLLTVNLNISYFNSSTSKALMNFFDILEKAHDKGKKIAQSDQTTGHHVGSNAEKAQRIESSS